MASRSVAEGSSDLGTIEERRRAANPVGDAGLPQRLGDEVGLRVGAHEHRLLRPRPPGWPRQPDGPGDRDGLRSVVGVALGRAAARRRPGRRARREPAAGRLGGRRRRREDLGRRPVAARELDDLGRRPPAVDVEEEAGVGAVPPVDRLLRVADRRHVVAVAPPRLEQAELQRVHVLELVDEEVAEPPALRRREGLVLLERPGDQREQVVEVDEAAATLAVLVAGVDVGDQLGPQDGLAPRLAHRGHVVVGRDHAGLGPLDLGGQLAGDGALVLAGHRRRQLREQPALAVEQREGGCARGRPTGCAGCAHATAWKVPVVASPRSPSRRSRSSSSPAALRVKVRASTWRGSAEPVATR